MARNEHTVSEVAAAIGIDEDDVQQLIEAGQLGSVRRGGEHRIPFSSLERFLDRGASLRRPTRNPAVRGSNGNSRARRVGGQVRPSEAQHGDAENTHFTVADVARMYRVSDRTVRNWIKRRWLHAEPLGRLIRISAASLSKFQRRRPR